MHLWISYYIFVAQKVGLQRKVDLLETITWQHMLSTLLESASKTAIQH